MELFHYWLLYLPGKHLNISDRVVGTSKGLAITILPYLL